MTQTIAEQLKSQGVHGSADTRLDAALRDTVKRGGDVNDVLQALADDPEAILCLFDVDEIERRIRWRLTKIKRELQAEARESSAASPQAGPSNMHADSNEGYDRTGAERNGGGSKGPASKVRDDAAGKADGTSKMADDSKSNAEPSRQPSAPRASLDAFKAHAEVVARSLFDSFKITQRNGERMPIGDIAVHGLTNRAKAAQKRGWVYSREGIVCQMLAERAAKQAHVPKDARVRDIFGENDLKQMIELATAQSSRLLPYAGQGEVEHVV